MKMYDIDDERELFYNNLNKFIKKLPKYQLITHETYTNLNILNTRIGESFKNTLKNISNPTEITHLQIESIIDYLNDEINSGHWSQIPVYIRQAYTGVTYIKFFITIKNLNLNTLKKCLSILDLGLLLGAPLDSHEKILNETAEILTKLINQIDKSDLNVLLNVETIGKKYKSKSNYDDIHLIKAIQIKSIIFPTIETFYKNYFLPQIPLKLKECMNNWPAMSKWVNINYLLNVAGNRTVPIEVGNHYVDENWTQKLMTLKEFITKHFYDSNNKDLGYLAQHNLFDQITELKNDIIVPDYCSLSLSDKSEEVDINAWFGPEGTVSPLHFDPKNNILAQVFGVKQVLLFSNSDDEYLYPHENTLLSNTSQVNPLKPDNEKFKNFHKATMYKCLLEPGDMLFIPKKWWHHVTALEKSFSVSFWWQ